MAAWLIGWLVGSLHGWLIGLLVAGFVGLYAPYSKTQAIHQFQHVFEDPWKSPRINSKSTFGVDLE